jgi:flagellar biosynthesis protein FlhF
MSTPEKASNLYVKSFFAASIKAAIDQAQRELGPDALLLNVREAPAEARHLGEYEAVFGGNHETIAATIAAGQPITPAVAQMPAATPIAEARPADHRRPLRKRAEQRPQPQDNLAARRTRLLERRAAARKRIAKASVLSFTRPEEIETADEAPEAPSSNDLAASFSVQPEIGRITALVGPPGSGKTTTLVKLAVTECLKQGRPLQFFSIDTVRIGGAYQLRTYAAILGVPFQAVETAAALERAIDAAPTNAYLLIDTPGYSAALQEEIGEDLAKFLRRRHDIDTHLVLTASMGQAELRNVTDRLAAFNPSKLIFTHLDETTSTASVVSEAARTERPVSFLCNGQTVPEDILPASKDLILSSLVRQLPNTLQAVA